MIQFNLEIECIGILHNDTGNLLPLSGRTTILYQCLWHSWGRSNSKTRYLNQWQSSVDHSGLWKIFERIFFEICWTKHHAESHFSIDIFSKCALYELPAIISVSSDQDYCPPTCFLRMITFEDISHFGIWNELQGVRGFLTIEVELETLLARVFQLGLMECPEIRFHNVYVSYIEVAILRKNILATAVLSDKKWSLSIFLERFNSKPCTSNI